MALHIEFTVGDCDKRELDALAALIASLGGRAPATGSITVGDISLGGLSPEQLRELIPTAVVADAPDAPTITDPAAAFPSADAPPPPPADAPTPPPVSDGYTGPWPRELPGGVKIDSRGFPHDLRIHASTATTKKDGSWTYKRGAAEELIAQVEVELRKVMSAPVPDAPPPPGDVPPPPADAPPPPVADAPPPPADAPPPPPPSSDETAIGEFARIMRIVLAKQAAGTLTTEATTKIAMDLGLASMKDLRNRPDLIPAFEALLP